MNEATTKLLEQLAAKFGTTVERLWSVLLQQATVEAWYSSAWIALMVSILILWSRVNLRWYRAVNWNDDSCATVCVISVVINVLWGGATVIVCVCLSHNLFTGFLNPEYWALKQLLP